MGSLIPFTRGREPAPRRPLPLTTAARQLDLVLDDPRTKGMKSAERQAAVRSLAQLLLEAAGVATREVGDEHE